MRWSAKVADAGARRRSVAGWVMATLVALGLGAGIDAGLGCGEADSPDDPLPVLTGDAAADGYAAANSSAGDSARRRTRPPTTAAAGAGAGAAAAKANPPPGAATAGAAAGSDPTANTGGSSTICLAGKKAGDPCVSNEAPCRLGAVTCTCPYGPYGASRLVCG